MLESQAAKEALKMSLADLAAGRHETVRVQAALDQLLEQQKIQDTNLARAKRSVDDLATEAASIAAATQKALQREHEQVRASTIFQDWHPAGQNGP